MGIPATLSATLIALAMAWSERLWPAVALVSSYELLMMVIRSCQVPAVGAPAAGHGMDPLRERAAELFAGRPVADWVPSVRAIRAELHVGQGRAQRLRGYLAAGSASSVQSPAA